MFSQNELSTTEASPGARWLNKKVDGSCQASDLTYEDAATYGAFGPGVPAWLSA